MERAIRRVRHEIKRRQLQVSAVERVTPHYVRITLGGAELEGFTSLGFDDHVKLFFPTDGEPAMRDYTPRRYDAAKQELVIEFALHETGPASDWAAQAKVGDALQLGGPRGSQVVEGDFDWHLLAGDETAIPAISRRIEELPAGAIVLAFVEVANEAEQVTLPAHAGLKLVYAHRDSGKGLLDAVKAAEFPAGTPFAFVGAEAEVARSVKEHLLARGLDAHWLKASGYWQKGDAGVHVSLGEGERGGGERGGGERGGRGRH